MTAILGISAYYHDSAAALIVDGQVVAAAQEERFSRKKHDDSFPTHAIDYCLEAARVQPDDLDYVAFYDKPLLKFERLLETYLSFAPRGLQAFTHAMPLWLRQKLHLPREMRKALRGAYRKRFLFAEHHESHAASAFFPSPFSEAAILTFDGVGEWATASYGVGRGNRIHLTHEQRFPHSLGLLYSAFTYYCGFTVNSGEYKLMGLAPYGEPKYVDLIHQKLIDLREDGSFQMDLSYFSYCHGLTMTSQKFDQLLGAPRRKPDEPIRQIDMDAAASVQKVTEEIILRAARHLHEETGMKYLCLAGGVALNCVGNGRILREGPFEDLWIQPAAGDAGGALGVALLVWHQLLDNPRTARPEDQQSGSLLGVEFDDAQIESYLKDVGARYERFDDDETLCRRVASAIDDGKVVGWFQGRMEFGPRALGSRSLLGDARNTTMQSVMNKKIKFREGFRPFAPIVLRDHVHEYFQFPEDYNSPYMLLVAPVQAEKRLPDSTNGEVQGIDKLKQQRSVIPAVTHVDYSARVQTVDADRHGLLHKLMETFYQQTGCPVMVNTSFNLGWEPIVGSPADAYRTFMSCEMDLLCMGRFLLNKTEQRATVNLVRDSTSDEVFDGKLLCPCCRESELVTDDGQLRCTTTGRSFPVTDNIPQLFWPHERFDDPGDVTQAVKQFYEETPFPNYDDHDTLRSLIEKSRRSAYAYGLDASIPYNSSVLEVGCGTGQLTNFLGIACRRVIGTDMCLNSLRLGEQFRRQHGLARVRFLQMNLFRPAVNPAQFDVVISNGVLHHTADAYGGFQALVPLVKPGGHIIVGLYNRLGRVATDLRRGVFRLTGDRGRWLDPILRAKRLNQGQRRAWFSDQYRHPHETKHTIGQVQQWFQQCGLEFVRSIPSVVPEVDQLEPSSLFVPTGAGTTWNRFAVQMKQVITGSREGGYFVMIGRRPDSQPDAVAEREPTAALQHR